jgi:rhamnose transport system substrate-binding protein
MKKTIMLMIALVLILAPAGFLMAAGAEDDGVERHAFIFKNTGNPYGDKQMQGFADGIEEMGFEAITRAPDQPTAEAQIQIIEQLIAQKVDSISITGNDYDALEPALKKAKDAGIAVLSADSAVNPASRITHINQADSEMIGRDTDSSRVRHGRRRRRDRDSFSHQSGIQPESLDRMDEERA